MKITIGLNDRNLISHSSRSWEVQNQSSRRVSFLVRALFLACGQLPSCCVLPASPLHTHTRERASSLMSLLRRALIPPNWGLTLMTISNSQQLPKGLSLSTITLGLELQHTNFGGTQTFSP